MPVFHEVVELLYVTLLNVEALTKLLDVWVDPAMFC